VKWNSSQIRKTRRRLTIAWHVRKVQEGGKIIKKCTCFVNFSYTNLMVLLCIPCMYVWKVYINQWKLKFTVPSIKWYWKGFNDGFFSQNRTELTLCGYLCFKLYLSHPDNHKTNHISVKWNIQFQTSSAKSTKMFSM
jgi:hypothetical protein